MTTTYDHLAQLLADTTTPDTTVHLNRDTGTITLTTTVRFPPGETAERAHDLIQTRVRVLQAFRATLTN